MCIALQFFSSGPWLLANAGRHWTNSDSLVVVAYFACILLIGWLSAHAVQDRADYFLASHTFGKVFHTLGVFAQSTSTENVLAVCSATFVDGIAGVWTGLTLLLITPFFWLITPWYQRLRVFTLADFFTDRYQSKLLATSYAVFALVGTIVVISLTINASAKTIAVVMAKDCSHLTDSERIELQLAAELHLLEIRDYETMSVQHRDRLSELRAARPRQIIPAFSYKAIIAGMCALMISCTIVGGLRAVFYSKLIQGLAIIVVSILLFVSAYRRINELYGGQGFFAALRALRTQLPESRFDLFGATSAVEFTWYYILALAVMSLLHIAVQPNQLITTVAAKDEITARVGMTSGLLIKRAVTILWAIYAMFLVVIYHGHLQNPDYAWGRGAVDLLGPLQLGMVGMFMVATLSLFMARIDCMMMTSAGLITQNLYAEFFAKRSDSELILVGRVTGALVIGLGGLMAIGFDDFLRHIEFWWGFYAVFSAPFWLGMMWRGATEIAALVTVAVTLLFFLILPAVFPLLPGIRADPRWQAISPSYVVTESYPADSLASTIRLPTAGQVPKRAGRQLNPDVRSTDRPNKWTRLVPGRAIYWDQGVRPNRHEVMVGHGTLKVELMALSWLGWDLSKNTHALNKTLSCIARIVVPLALMWFVSCVTRHPPGADEAIDTFFAKLAKSSDLDLPRGTAVGLDSQESGNRKPPPRDSDAQGGSDWIKWGGFIATSAIALLLLAMLQIVLLVSR